MTTFSSPLYFKQRNSTILLEINNHVTSQDPLECFQILTSRYYSKKVTPQGATAVFSLTLARSPMASRSYRRASDFLNYSPGLASDILAERKSEKKEEKNFF